MLVPAISRGGVQDITSDCTVTSGASIKVYKADNLLMIEGTTLPLTATAAVMVSLPNYITFPDTAHNFPCTASPAGSTDYNKNVTVNLMTSAKQISAFASANTTYGVLFHITTLIN